MILDSYQSEMHPQSIFSAELWRLQYLMSSCKPHISSLTSRSALAQFSHTDMIDGYAD